MAREYFHHPASKGIVEEIDRVARRSGLDRARVFDDFLRMAICALSKGQMEEEYMEVIEPYTAGTAGKRSLDMFPEILGTVVHQMEETRADILGDVFQGAITYGQDGQFFTPDPVCQLMAQLVHADDAGRTVYDSCCGSGRLLLAAAHLNRNREFIGQDVDIRCVRITAINLALWNLYGWVIQGNSLTLEKKLVYRTGFDGKGVVKRVPPEECPYPVAGMPSAPRPMMGTLENEPAPENTATVQKNLFE